MAALLGVRPRWSSEPGDTKSVAPPVAIPSVPVTSWRPATTDVHEVPPQDPPPLIVTVVDAVTSPRELP